MVHPAGRRTTRSSPCTGRPSSSSARSGPRRRTSSRTGRSRSTRWEHNSRLDLVKWPEWRNADDVSLERVNGRMISEGTTAVQAFEAGELDMTARPAARGAAAPQGHARVRAVPGARHLLLRVQRRRRCRTSTSGGRWPSRSTAARSSTTSRRPTSCRRPASRRRGCRASTRSTRTREWLPETGDIEQAKELMNQVQNPVTQHHAAPQRLAGPPRDRGRDPGDVEGARPERRDPAAGVGPVPRVHRASAGRLGGRCSATAGSATTSTR